MRHPREFKLYDRHSYFLPSLFFCFVLRLDNSLASEFDIGIGTFKLPGDRWLSLSHLGTTVLAGHIFCYPRGTSSWNIATSSITRLGRPGGFTSFLSFHVVAVIHFSWRSSSSIVRISQTSFSYRTMSHFPRVEFYDVSNTSNNISEQFEYIKKFNVKARSVSRCKVSAARLRELKHSFTLGLGGP